LGFRIGGRLQSYATVTQLLHGRKVVDTTVEIKTDVLVRNFIKLSGQVVVDMEDFAGIFPQLMEDEGGDGSESGEAEEEVSFIHEGQVERGSMRKEEIVMVRYALTLRVRGMLIINRTRRRKPGHLVFLTTVVWRRNRFQTPQR
jgi:hypothetical protein